jgi:UDP-GlcNAc:undecaprenyl-phosphate GlcNAc-1-phosphate transferase
MGLLKGYTIATIFIAVLVLGLPIFDTAFAILRRFLAGKPIMSPDRGHLHHRLIDKGFDQKHSVLILYAVSGVSGISAILISLGKFYGGACVFLVAVAILILNMTFVAENANASDKNEKNDK